MVIRKTRARRLRLSSRTPGRPTFLWTAHCRQVGQREQLTFAHRLATLPTRPHRISRSRERASDRRSCPMSLRGCERPSRILPILTAKTEAVGIETTHPLGNQQTPGVWLRFRSDGESSFLIAGHPSHGHGNHGDGLPARRLRKGDTMTCSARRPSPMARIALCRRSDSL